MADGSTLQSRIHDHFTMRKVAGSNPERTVDIRALGLPYAGASKTNMLGAVAAHALKKYVLAGPYEGLPFCILIFKP